MIKILEKNKCSGCYACQSICPTNCIRMLPDEEGFLYPIVEEDKCIKCCKCEKVCPIIFNSEKKEDFVNEAYAVKNKDIGIRLNSSSGGFFTSIAKYVINKGGVVFGAIFSQNFEVIHSFVDREETLEKLRGSKYVQSKMEDSFLKAKEFLDDNKWVLFSGTPCQIEGLLSYLNRPYEKLITQDIICHGVPSPLVWQKYLSAISKDGCEKISFRNKDLGWHNFSIKIDYNNKKSYQKSLGEDLFLKVFLNNLCLRPSCYNCSFKKENRLSDFTIADYWGIENVHPEFDDNKGVSFIILNSIKASRIFEEIKEDLDYMPTDKETAISYNQAMIKSSKYNPKRDSFMNDIVNKPFVKVAKRYTKASFKTRTVNNAKRIVKKLIGWK